MGTFYRATCACGHETDMVLEGSGFSGVPVAPAICRHCRDVISVRVGAKRLRCPRCRRKPELLDLGDDDDGQESLVRDRPHSCPACGKKTLRLMPQGTWD